MESSRLTRAVDAPAKAYGAVSIEAGETPPSREDDNNGNRRDKLFSTKRKVAFVGCFLVGLVVAAISSYTSPRHLGGQQLVEATSASTSSNLGAAGGSRTFTLHVACVPDAVIAEMEKRMFNTKIPVTNVYVVPVTPNDDAYMSIDKGFRMRASGPGTFSVSVPREKLAFGWAFAISNSYGFFFDAEAQKCAGHEGDEGSFVLGTCLTACPASWVPPTPVAPLNLPSAIKGRAQKAMMALFAKRLARRTNVGAFVNFMRVQTNMDADAAAALATMMKNIERTEGAPTGINPGWDAASLASSVYNMIMQMKRAKGVGTETASVYVKLIAENVNSLGDFNSLASDLSGVSTFEDLLTSIPTSLGVPAPVLVHPGVVPAEVDETNAADAAAADDDDNDNDDDDDSNNTIALVEDEGAASPEQIAEAGLIVDPNVLYPVTITPVKFTYTSPAITAFLAGLESADDAAASMERQLTLDAKILYFLSLLNLDSTGEESVFEGVVPWLAGLSSGANVPGILAKLYELFNYLNAITESPSDGLAFYNLVFAQLTDLRSFNKLLTGIKLNVADADAFNLDALTQQVTSASIQEELIISASSVQGPKKTTEVPTFLDKLIDSDKGSCVDGIVGFHAYGWFMFTYPTMMEFAGVHVCGDSVNQCRSQKLQIFLDDQYMGSHDTDGGCVDIAFAQNVTARRMSILRDFSDRECKDWQGYMGDPDDYHSMKLCSVEPAATAVGEKLPALAPVPEPIIYLGKDVKYSVTMSSGESTAEKMITMTIISQQDIHSAVTEEEENPWIQVDLDREMDIHNIAMCGTTHKHVPNGRPEEIDQCRMSKLKIEVMRNGTVVAVKNDASATNTIMNSCDKYSLGDGVHADAVRISRDYSDGACEGKTTNKLGLFYVDLLGRNTTTRTLPGFMHTFFEDGGSSSGDSYAQLEVNLTVAYNDSQALATPAVTNGGANLATSSLYGVDNPPVEYAKLMTDSTTDCTRTIEGLDAKASLTYNFPDKQYLVEGVKICGMEFADDEDNCQSKNLVVSMDDAPVGTLDAVGCVTAKFPKPVKGSSLTISRDSSSPKCFYKNPVIFDFLPGNSTPGMHLCGLKIYGTATEDNATASPLPEPFRLLTKLENWTATTSTGNTAAKVYDSHFSNTFAKGYCSTTEDEENPHLNVSFSGDIEVKSFMVCGRNDGDFDCRSQKLTVKAMRHGAVVKTITDVAASTAGNTRCAMVKIDDTLDHLTGTLLDGVIISRDFSGGDCEGKTANQLQICEVRAYARAPAAA